MRPPGRCLSPPPANVYPLTGIGSCKSLLEPRAPPGRGPTRIIMLVNHGGTATQPRAPGHERPHAALCAARHGRLSAASTAPGADIPPATTAGAPGQYCQSAAPRAPGHGRPLAITAGVPCHDRLSAAPLAPGAVVASAVTAEAPRQHRLSAAPIATVALPVGQRRLRQAGLPHTPANPRTQTYSSAHQNTASTPTRYRPPTRHTLSRERGEAIPSPTTHQVHPAIQVPPQPRPCSTAAGDFPLHHPSRAPPHLDSPSPSVGEGAGG